MLKYADVAVVIPIYREKLNSFEKISLMQAMNILKKYDIVLVMPKGLHIDLVHNCKVEYFSKEYFLSISSYNRLMLSEEFYCRFGNYKYILIYQLDAFVFLDELLYFCSLGYDYVGAPWLHGIYKYVDEKHCVWNVGNGGLSLRKISSFIRAVREEKENIKTYEGNEDVFFSTMNYKWFKVAPMDIALQFSFEREVENCYEKNGRNIPFGCHAWERYNFRFWKPFIEKYGYKFYESEDVSGNEDVIRKGEYEHLSKVSFFWNNYKADMIKNQLSNLFTENGKEYVIFGAGLYGIELSKWMENAKIQIKFFCDNNRQLVGKMINHKYLVFEPFRLMDYKDQVNIIIATTRYGEEVREQLIAMGLEYKTHFIKFEDIVNNMENWVYF